MFYLLYHNKWVRKEALIDALWPELPPGRANSLFRTTLYRLRKVIHPDAVLFEAGRLRLNPLGRFWHDASDFERLMDEAAKLPSDNLDKGSVLERALDLYKGPFLEDVYSEWTGPIRTRFDVLYHKALLELAKFLLGRGNHRRALELCETLIQLDDSDEEFYALAVKCSALAGDHELATRYLLRYEAKAGDTVATPQGSTVARTYQTLVSGSKSTLV
ncbi:MAG: BTAD domain-containing putative transcriptional regulator, partial [Chloroflexota bacterium]|nr:BTAD domain-containing putative transcriptional regulator [Chloroflexota bacterium]